MEEDGGENDRIHQELSDVGNLLNNTDDEHQLDDKATCLIQDIVAFWIIGLCNNFAYVVVLTAAEDLIDGSSNRNNRTGSDLCLENNREFKCSPISAGAILLADIIPSLIVKMINPFVFQSLSYTLRHFFVVFSQIMSFIILSFSQDILLSLFGIALASSGAGLGEVTYLSLSSRFSNEVIGYWSSGTGGAGIFGALSFVILTDRRLLDIRPKNALLLMLIVPVVQALTFGKLFKNLQKQTIRRTSSFSCSEQNRSGSLDPLLNTFPLSNSRDEMITSNTIGKIKPLLGFMMPLSTVYFAEYLINQGLIEFVIFNCDHSFNMGRLSQYRWYQVLYQVGVFISRSSVKVIRIKPKFFPLLSLLQCLNLFIIFYDALFIKIPHIILVMLLILYEGLLGGGAYVNIFSAIHKMIPEHNKEFSMAFVSMSDSFGIAMAGLLSIPIHNFICGYRNI